MSQHKRQSWDAIHLAEQLLIAKPGIKECSYCDITTTSVMAQKGVNAVLLKEYGQALPLLNTGLHQYNPMHLRGRARLIAQKAEAYYGLGCIDESAETAIDAFHIAHTIGSQKTIARVKNLYTLLNSSPYRKEKSVAQLGATLTLN
ncbi:hypothetical protein [Dictyobacter vulcani]|nr:hypothetical protein [Dictyobacter vulcani]